MTTVRKSSQGKANGKRNRRASGDGNDSDPGIPDAIDGTGTGDGIDSGIDSGGSDRGSVGTRNASGGNGGSGGIDSGSSDSGSVRDGTVSDDPFGPSVGSG